MFPKTYASESPFFFLCLNLPLVRVVIPLELFDSSLLRSLRQPAIVCAYSTLFPHLWLFQSQHNILLRITARALCFLHASHLARPWPTSLWCRDGSAVFVEDRLPSWAYNGIVLVGFLSRLSTALAFRRLSRTPGNQNRTLWAVGGARYTKLCHYRGRSFDQIHSMLAVSCFSHFQTHIFGSKYHIFIFCKSSLNLLKSITVQLTRLTLTWPSSQNRFFAPHHSCTNRFCKQFEIK